MRLILIIVSIFLFSLFVVWGLNQYIKRREYTMTTAQELMQQEGNQPAVNPVEYSKDKVNEINQRTLEHSEEFDQLP